MKAINATYELENGNLLKMERRDLVSITYHELGRSKQWQVDPTDLDAMAATVGGICEWVYGGKTSGPWGVIWKAIRRFKERTPSK
jgi:hypothetical protein